jgi:hypothetical protein
MLKFRHYLKELLKVTFYIIIVLTGLSFVPQFDVINAVSWFSMLFFFFFHLAFGYYGTRGLDKPIFIYIFLGGMVAEFSLSIAFIVLWYKIFHPITNYFVLPFMLFFTIYKLFSVAIFLKYFNKINESATNITKE